MRRARDLLRPRLGGGTLAAADQRHRAPRPRGRLSRVRPPPRVPTRPRALPRRRPACAQRAGRHRRTPHRRISRCQLLDRRQHPVGARRVDRSRFHLRLEHLSDPPRSLRHPELQPYAGAHRARCGCDSRDPAVDGAAAGTELAGRRRRLLPPLPVLADAPRHRVAQSARTTAGVVYVHPWELDVDQPRLHGGLRARLQYTNLHRTEARLRRLLREFRFAPVRDVFGACAA